jgi:hypothetical protein
MRAARWFMIAVLAVHVPLACYSGYRAIVQVYSLKLRVPSELQAGSRLGYDVATSGRTNVHVRLLMIQGTRAETLTVGLVRDHENPSYDPRTIHASADVDLSPSMLADFDEGPAVIRGVAIGGPQWFRTPPPTITEERVVLKP